MAFRSAPSFHRSPSPLRRLSHRPTTSSLSLAPAPNPSSLPPLPGGTPSKPPAKGAAARFEIPVTVRASTKVTSSAVIAGASPQLSSLESPEKPRAPASSLSPCLIVNPLPHSGLAVFGAPQKQSASSLTPYPVVKPLAHRFLSSDSTQTPAPYKNLSRSKNPFRLFCQSTLTSAPAPFWLAGSPPTPRPSPSLSSLSRDHTSRIPRAAAMAPASGDAASKKVLVPVANGTEEMEAVIVVDVLRRAGADVTVASVESELQVTASRKVKLIADKSIEVCLDDYYDLVVLPGGMPGAERLRDSEAVKSIVTRLASEGKEVAAICAAPVVALAAWGLLQGKKATAHPAFSDRLDDTSAVSARVVEDGNVVTSRGPGTAFEFALKLVERLYGAEKAAAVAKPMVMASGARDDRWRLEAGPAQDAKGSARVLVPIANGTEEMEAVIVIDVLRRAGADVVVASVEGSLEVVASRKVKLVADVAIADAMGEFYDLVVLPGGMPGAERLRDSAALDAILTAQAAASQPLAAICAAPVVALKPKGLLDGKKATAHSAFSKDLPDQDAVGARVVRDGAVVTSRGPGTAFEFALFLVEFLFGPEKAASVASPMVMPEPRGVAAA